jgi:hypothetical protein
MNLTDLRDKITIFLVPMAIIILIVWSLVALIGQTYFWDVSRLSIQIPWDTPSKVQLDIRARLIYFDADFFGFYYPVHIVLPFSRTQTCIRECFFDRLPAGDGTIIFATEDNASSRTQIYIAPDTQGTINLRPAFTLVSVEPSLTSQLRAPLFSPEERDTLPWIIEVTNDIQGLFIFQGNGNYFLYDHTTKQSMLLPVKVLPYHVALSETPGQYLLWTDEGVMVWDRYGRTPMQYKNDSTHNGYTFTWSKKASTRLTSPAGEVILSGYWSPLFGQKIFSITNGGEIRQVR